MISISISYLCCHFTDSFSWIWVPVGSFHCFWGDVSKLDQVLYLCVSHIFLRLCSDKFRPQTTSPRRFFRWPENLSTKRGETTKTRGFDDHDTRWVWPAESALRSSRWSVPLTKKQAWIKNDRVFRWNFPTCEILKQQGPWSFLSRNCSWGHFSKGKGFFSSLFHGKITVQLLHSVPFEGHLFRNCKHLITYFLHIFTFRHFKSQVILI